MELSTLQTRIIQILQDGLPIVSTPYQAIAAQTGCTEQMILNHCQQLLENRSIKRLGVIVNHPKLGYTHNGMVVWDIPDAQADAVGARFGKYPFVTLSYRRPRRPPLWPYNLFCMIHGKSQAEVIQQVTQLRTECQLQHCPHDILFSTQQYKQRGGRYA